MRHTIAPLFVSTILALAFTPAAGAADMAVKAPMVTKAPAQDAAYNWTGFYAGGHFGYLWGRARVADDGVVTEENASVNGAIGGALAGYNWQTGPFVFGIEGDIGWTDAHGVGTTTVVLPNHYDARWDAHLRGRAGYAVNNVLFYAAGGFSLADLSFQEGGTTIAPGGKYYGWSIGGGVEYGVTRNLAARIEYLYDDFGHKDYTGVAGDSYRVGLTGQTVRGAVTWKFD